jgi:hypothetical protein
VDTPDPVRPRSRRPQTPGNEFTDIASTAILLGCTYDPLPTDPSEAAGISTPQNSTNINEDDSISDNIIHSFLKVRSDGGAIYAEGHYDDAGSDPCAAPVNSNASGNTTISATPAPGAITDS